MKIKLFFLALLLIKLNSLQSLIVNRAIVSSDLHPHYIDFWPLVAKAWKKLGIRPALALIAPDSSKVDTTIGDVIVFEPIPGIPTSFQAQVIRLLLPIYFPNDGCILSDIDMLPLNRQYYCDSVASIPDNHFVVYRDKAYEGGGRFPMCYVAAKGRTFQEVFKVNVNQIRDKIIEWYKLNQGWFTDENQMTKHLLEWNASTRRLVKLGHGVSRRIDRPDWIYNPILLKQNFYIDSHMLRPYSQYKQQIDLVASLAGIN